MLAALPTSRIVAACSASVAEGEKIVEEAMVCLCRRLIAKGESGGAWRIATLLGERVQSHIAQQLRLWRLDAPGARPTEIVDEMLAQLYDDVLDVLPRSAFWEIRFWVALDRRLLRILQSKRVEMDRLVQAGCEDGSSIDDMGESDERYSGIMSESALSEDPLMKALVAEAIRCIPEPARTAYLLKHLAGMPEESRVRNASETIAGVMGVTGRAVRNYLARAEKALALWRAGSPVPRKR